MRASAEFVQGIGEIVARGRDRLQVGVVQTDGQAAQRRDLRNAASHGATADNAQRPNLYVAKTHGVSHSLFARLARSYCLWGGPKGPPIACFA